MRPTTNPRILVVDDDPGVLASYRIVLEDHNPVGPRPPIDTLEREEFGPESPVVRAPKWDVQYADQGETAIELVKRGLENQNPFTAVFLDIRMPPGIDGYDTAEEIRKLDPRVHIVVVSGYSDFTAQDLLEVAGPPGRFTMMPKPVWPADLQSLATRICNDNTMRS